MTILALAILPVAMGLVVLLLRELRTIAALVSTATLVAVGILAATLGPDETIVILGRSVGLSTQGALALAFCAILLAFMVLHAYGVSGDSRLFPLTLVATGFFAGAMMVRNMAIAGLLLEAGVVAAVMLVPSRHPGAAMTGSRVLALLMLSAPLLLLASWAMEGGADDSNSVELVRMSGMALAIACALLLGIVPFHVWLPPIFRYGSSLAAVVLSVVLGTSVLAYFDNAVRAAVWPGGEEFFSILALAGGVATAIIGGLITVPQRAIRRALAYAALADLGLILVGLGIGTRTSTGAATLHVAYRGIGLATVSMALDILRADDLEHLRGGLRRAPLAAIAMIIGGFSVAGLPLTAGFTTRLVLYRALAANHPGWALAVMACSIGPAWTFTRCLVATLVSTPTSGARREPLLPGLLALLLSLVLLGLGLYPRLLTLLPKEWLATLGV